MPISKRFLIAFFATLTEIVIVAAVSNQAVTKALVQHESSSTIIRDLEGATLTFAWRFAPQSGAHSIWLGELIGDLSLFMLIFLLVALILRGPASFSSPFFATVCVVVTASVIAPIIRSLIDYNDIGRFEDTGLNRYTFALFDSSGGTTVAFGLASGIVAGLVAGFMGVVIRGRSNAAGAQQLAAGGFAPGMVPSPYGTPGQFGPAGSFGAPSSFAGPGGFGTFGSPSPYEGAPDATSQLPPGQFAQAGQYAQPDQYGQPDQYAQAQYPANPSEGEPADGRSVDANAPSAEDGDEQSGRTAVFDWAAPPPGPNPTSELPEVPPSSSR